MGETLGGGKVKIKPGWLPADLESVSLGAADKLAHAYQDNIEPHVAFELQGADLVPVIHPGRRAIDAAAKAGEPIPQFQVVPDSLKVRPDGGLDLADGAVFISEALQAAVSQVNQAVAAR